MLTAVTAVRVGPKVSVSDMAVEFHDVSFVYPGQERGRGLRGISFKVDAGTTTAIVGTTGAGEDENHVISDYPVND